MARDNTLTTCLRYVATGAGLGALVVIVPRGIKLIFVWDIVSADPNVAILITAFYLMVAMPLGALAGLVVWLERWVRS